MNHAKNILFDLFTYSNRLVVMLEQLFFHTEVLDLEINLFAQTRIKSFIISSWKSKCQYFVCILVKDQTFETKNNSLIFLNVFTNF